MRVASLARHVEFWVAVIAMATLVPLGGAPVIPRLCLICGERGSADALANIILFLPLGFTLSLRSRRRARYFIPFLLSFLVELAQHVIPGRTASLADVLFNTIGAGIGGWVGAHTHVWWNSSARTARVWFALTSASVLCILFLTAFLVTPAPTDETYFAHWTPEFRRLETYDGNVQSATLGTESLPVGALTNGAQVREQIMRAAPLSVRGSAGHRPRALAPVVAVTDERHQLLMLGIDGSAVSYYYRSRAAAWALDHIELRASRIASALHYDDPLRMEVRTTAAGVLLDVNGRKQLLRAPHLGMGWRFVGGSNPLPDWLKSLADRAWLLSLLMVLGYWSRPGWWTACVACLITAALALLPLFSWLAPTPPSAYLAAALGFLGGIYLGRRFPPMARAGKAIS